MLIALFLLINISFAADPPLPPVPRIFPPAKNQPTPQDQAKAQEFYKLSRAARQAETEGDWKKALELWQTIRKDRQDDFSAYGGIRRSLISLSRFDEALLFIDDALKLAATGTFAMDPSTIAADRIEVLFVAGRESAAFTEIDRQIAAQKGFPNIYRNIANVLYAQRHGDDAIELLKRGRTDSKNPYLFSREIAQFAEARMDWETAVNEDLLYLEESPDNLSYVIGTLGDIMLEPGGDTLIQKAISVKLKNAGTGKIDPLLELQASLLFRSREYAKSLDVYRRLNKLPGSDGELLYKIAQKLSEENEPYLALAAYNEFLKEDVPTDARFRTILKIARTYESLGLIDSAEISCKTILTPGAPLETIVEANYLLGKYSVLKKKPPKVAREYFESALSLARKSQPSSGINLDVIQISLAMTYQLDAKFDLAKKELEKVVRLSGTRANAAPQARLELARLAFRQGDLDEAKKQADALIAADPSSEMSNEVLELSALLDGLKDSPDILKLLGQADMRAILGKSDDALILLDSLASNGANSRIIEEALWKMVELHRDNKTTGLILNDLDRLIALDGETLRKDKALFYAGVFSHDNLSDEVRARKYYDKLLLDYPDSPLAERVRKLAKNIKLQVN